MTGDYSSEISSIINALTGKFARKDHSHSGGGGTITDEEWSNPTWNESYINVTTSTHLRLFRMGNLCTLKYYFATKSGVGIPTSATDIVTNIPTAFQPKYLHQEVLTNTSGKMFLMRVEGTDLKMQTYESSATAGTFTGSISYECKGDSVVPLLTCSANATAYVGDSLTISGVLSYNNTGIASASVKLYDGSTLVDTLTSDSSGAVSKTVTATEGTHSYKLVFEGDATYSNAESSSVSVVVSKRTPTISLSATSSTIYVGDTPSVSGTLSVGSGASVKIYSGSTLLDTVTTGTNGAFSYTGSATSTSGSISYKAVYDGDSAYESVESSSVTITVSKKTPTLSASASTSTPVVNSSFTISGTLKDSNSNINGASITISLNGSTVTTATTSSGAFSATITAPSSTGSYTYSVAYAGDSTYIGVGETVSVTVSAAPAVASVSLTGDKSIISAYDHESCTLTATVLDSSNNPVSGALVSFDIVSGGSVVSNIDTATTNSSGIATVSYSGNHAGDLNIQASVGIILSEIYGLIDAKYYASNSRIDSEAIPYNNDRYIFSSNYSISLGDKVVFRLHSIPDVGIVGFGSSNGYDGIFYRHDGHTDILRSVNQNRLNIESLYPSYASNPIWVVHDFCMTKIKSGSQYRANLSYDDEAVFDYWEVGNTINKIRVDKFLNDDYDIEVFVL